MTEEVAFQQPNGDGGAIHFDEGSLAPGAQAVDSTGDEFFASARLAED
ncbi:MAG TPA: hypothetical protein VNY05_02790 [Candidatus Acidoferrales bacterium]|nr:hypothetical protein [Candidatus Acidoferrales bacterium]